MEKATLLYSFDPKKGISMKFKGSWSRSMFEKMVRDVRKGVQKHKLEVRREYERRQAESK